MLNEPHVQLKCPHCGQQNNVSANEIQSAGFFKKCRVCYGDLISKEEVEEASRKKFYDNATGVIILVLFIAAIIWAFGGNRGKGYAAGDDPYYDDGFSSTPVVVPAGSGYRSSSRSTFSRSSRTGSAGSRYRSSGGPSRGK